MQAANSPPIRSLVSTPQVAGLSGYRVMARFGYPPRPGPEGQILLILPTKLKMRNFKISTY
jgi:hypothetical protein